MNNSAFQRVRFPAFFYAISIFFWIAILYGSLDNMAGNVNIAFENSLVYIFSSRFPTEQGLYSVEWAMVILSFYLISRYGKNYTGDRKSAVFLLFALITIIFLLCNPNNTDNVLMLFFSKESKFVILFPLMLCSLIFLRKYAFSHIIIKILQIGFWFVMIKSISSLIYLLLGKGVDFMVFKATITQSDVQYFIHFYQLLLLFLFLNTRKKKYLLFSLILFIVILLGYRRTAVFNMLFSDIVFFIFFLLKSFRVKYFTYTVVLLVLIPAIFFILSSAGLYSSESVINRQLSALSYFNPSYERAEVKDSGHFEQAIETTGSMMDDLTFWGGGIKKGAIYLRGQTVRIHSSLAFGMAKYGIFVSIYYIGLFIYFLIITGMLVLQRDNRPSGLNIKLFQFLILIQILTFFISGWVSGDNLFDIYTQIYLNFILLYSLLRMDENVLEGYLMTISKKN
jgi:hypothetical protein